MRFVFSCSNLTSRNRRQHSTPLQTINRIRYNQENFKHLATFLEELQDAGIPVGLRELDWLRRIFALQPALNRQGLREVLQCTLIKTPQHRQRFDDLFEAMYPLELPDPSGDEECTNIDTSEELQEVSEQPVTTTTSTQTEVPSPP